jgi:hypothetical protein
MFNDFGAFHASLQQAWPEKNVPQEKAKAYYEWYQKARLQKQIVLGREKDLEGLKALYGVAEKNGSMLIGVTNWGILVNDSRILGGIHGQMPFLLKTVLAYSTVYNVAQKDNPDQTRVMYVTTREIAGLNLFGYRRNADNADGQLFLCEDKNAATNANFQSYRIHTQAVAAAALS